MSTLTTTFTRLVGIRHPVVLAGMGSGTTSPGNSVAAVSNAGGLGSLGAPRRDADEVRMDIRRIRALTDALFTVESRALLSPTRGPGGVLRGTGDAFIAGLGRSYRR